MPYNPYTVRPKLKSRNGPGVKIALLVVTAFALAAAGTIAVLIATLS